MSQPPFTPCQPWPYCSNTAQMRLGAENPTYFQQMVRGGASEAAMEVGGLAVEEELLGIPRSGNVIGGAWYDPTLYGYEGGAERDYNQAPGMGVVDQYQTKRRGWRALYGVDLPNVPVAPGNMWIGGADDDDYSDDEVEVEEIMTSMDTGAAIVQSEEPDLVDMIYMGTERYLPGWLAYLNPLYTAGKVSEAFANLIT